MKVFNTTGKCIPSMHYMVDISRQVEAAAKLVRRGNSFASTEVVSMARPRLWLSSRKSLREKGMLCSL